MYMYALEPPCPRPHSPCYMHAGTTHLRSGEGQGWQGGKLLLYLRLERGEGWSRSVEHEAEPEEIVHRELILRVPRNRAVNSARELGGAPSTSAVEGRSRGTTSGMDGASCIDQPKGSIIAHALSPLKLSSSAGESNRGSWLGSSGETSPFSSSERVCRAFRRACSWPCLVASGRACLKSCSAASCGQRSGLARGAQNKNNNLYVHAGSRAEACAPPDTFLFLECLRAL